MRRGLERLEERRRARRTRHQPITAGLSLDSLLGPAYFAPNRADVLCLGAGGAATAIVLHFVHKPDATDRPRRMVIVNRSPGRLETLQKMVGALKTDIAFDYRLNALPKSTTR